MTGRKSRAYRRLMFAQRFGWIDAAIREYPSGRRTHREARNNPFAINIVLKGSGTYADGSGRSYAVSPGTALFSLAGYAPRITYDSPRGTREFYCAFDRYTSRSLRDLGFVQQCAISTLTPGTQLENRCRRVLALIDTEPDALSDQDLLLKLIVFIRELQHSASSFSPAESIHEQIERACTLLENIAYRHHSIGDIAREVGISYHAFRSHFRSLKGCSAVEYRIERRIEQARVLLKDLPVKMVAHALGYPDSFTFSAQFKKMTGVAPSQYARSAG